MSEPELLLEAEKIFKRFGAVSALEDVTLQVRRGRVTCLLGDNGAGKSTLIKILSGVLQPDAGVIRIGGTEVKLQSPMDALDRGIATVFQDLAVVPIMPVFRNFFIGREPTTGWGPWRHFNIRLARKVSREQLHRIGIDLDDVNRPVLTLSGGQRQSVAIGRAIHFGAKVLILDEPTSALGVREAATVLRYVRKARDQGVGVILITHNAHHAFPVGDTFVILTHGTMLGTFDKQGLTLEQLTTLMAGGKELQRLEEEVAEDAPGGPP
jgi:simple sugar transport system ATP-binding protein